MSVLWPAHVRTVQKTRAKKKAKTKHNDDVMTMWTYKPLKTRTFSNNPRKNNPPTLANHQPNTIFREQVQQRNKEILAEQNALRIQERSCNIMQQLHLFKKASFKYIVTTRDDNPKQEELEMLYRTLSNQMRACYIPIISFDKFHPE
jgi:hypothetical protein